jgi:hypothetical protein
VSRCIPVAAHCAPQSLLKTAAAAAAAVAVAFEGWCPLVQHPRLQGQQVFPLLLLLHLAPHPQGLYCLP